MKVLILCGLFLFLIASSSFCEETAAAALNQNSDLESSLDPIVKHELQARHVPGVVVTVVLDGQIVLSKGYGFSNREERTPIKTNKTLFRMGSISKLFTTTAILQLVEQGKLKLDDDVNKYLKTFQIDNPFPEPVRVFHLLTHTGGFDERNLGSATLKESQAVPLGKYLARRMPPVVRRPGDLISYSNHGFTLAGYLVELISGVPFDIYESEHILKPLGMHNSTFTLRADDSSDLATGYIFQNRQYQSVPFDYVNDVPADGLVSTASDMTRFMIENLQQGQFHNVQILNPESIALMQTRHFTHNPDMPGWCYGWYEEYKNNLRALVHDGTVYGFTSRIYLVPEKHFGFFVATNRDVTSGGSITTALGARLLDYYFPATGRHSHPEALPDFPQRVHLYEGYYRETCYATRTLEKIEVLMGWAPQIKVEATPDGTLMIGDREFVEIKPFLFEQTSGKLYASFRHNENNPATHVFIDQDAFERLQWYDTNRFQLTFAACCLAVFVLTCVVCLLRLLWWKRSSAITRVYVLSGIISAAHLIFIAVLFKTIVQRDYFELTYPVPTGLKFGLVLPILGTILTLLLVVSIFQAWRARTGRLIGRIYFSLTTLAAVAYLWVLNYWNLIGFRY